jgi:murein tripeptide amidase MpaA
MKIDADLDGGSIRVLRADAPDDVALALRRDTNAEFMQWFHFRVRDAARAPLRMQIVNAGEATYADGFAGYRACASYDGEEWFRVPTAFEDGVLTLAHEPAEPLVHYAYFAPYPFARHQRLLARARRAKRARVETLGRSVGGRAMSLVTVGEPAEGRRVVWIIARQHPGETMAEWFMEGVLERLTDRDDALAKELLERAVFHLVPNMNPDGGVLGNQRSNAAGRDLNRAWDDPDEGETPEVCCVRERMLATGADLFLDVHGDERDPYCFAAGCEGNPGYDERIDALEDLFMDSLCALDEEFQREFGYPLDAPGEGDLSCAGNWVGQTFDCLSLTMEMPFKDDANHPDPSRGWSPARSRQLGRAALESALVCMDSLR